VAGKDGGSGALLPGRAAPWPCVGVRRVIVGCFVVWRRQWRSRIPPDSVSMAQAVLALGVVDGSGRGWLDRWAGGGGGVGGPTVCLCTEPLPCTPSFRFEELFRAVGGILAGVVGDPWLGGHLWSYAGRSGSAFGGGVARGTCAMSVPLRLGCEPHG
jgi:hypothetical protein